MTCGAQAENHVTVVSLLSSWLAGVSEVKFRVKMAVDHELKHKTAMYKAAGVEVGIPISTGYH